MKHTKVAIIGAGVAGIAATKSLLEKGIEPVVYEKSKRTGGLWNYGKMDGSPLYPSLHTNVSKQMMAFSDFPFQEEVPNFPSHQQVKAYLTEYVQNFNLEPYIVFGAEVIQINFLDAGFELSIGKEGSVETFFYDKLVIATGRFAIPHVPSIPGLASFSGTTMHSKEYDTPEAFRGQSVLVVGASASGSDIAAELHGIASAVHLSVRNMPWLIPKSIKGKPTDHSLTWLKARIPKGLREKGFRKILVKEYVKRGASADTNQWPIPAPAIDLEKTRLVPNDAIITLLINRQVGAYPAIASIAGSKVTFTSGASLSVDAMILATGYQTTFPFFRQEDMHVTKNYLGLYKQIFHPQHPNLAFVGVANIVGAALPLMEMQSRYISEVFAEHISLPPSPDMQKEVTLHKQRCEQKQVDPMRVQALSYLDEIAQIIGVSPRFVSHRKVFKELIAGPLAAFRYRLNGPNSSSKAAKRNIKEAVVH